MAGGARLVEGLLGVGGPDEGGVFGAIERDGQGQSGDEDGCDGAWPAGGPSSEHPARYRQHKKTAKEEGYLVDALTGAGGCVGDAGYSEIASDCSEIGAGAACEERAVDV